MTTDLELEKTLRALAARTVAQPPSAEQCARILDRRARGERVRLPARTALRRWRGNPGLAALAAIAAGLGVIVVAFPPDRVRRQDEREPYSASALLAPRDLIAQPAGLQAFPRFGVGASDRLRPGRWTYTADLTREVQRGDTLFVYALIPTTYQGSEAWLALAGMQVDSTPPVYSDSTWLSRTRLDVLGHRRDTLVTWQPVASTILTLLRTAPLDATWAASVALPGTVQDRQNGRRWMNLKVYGRETIDVPAGHCHCWKVGFRPSLGFFFWVNQDGVTMRQGMSRIDDYAFGRMNLGLVRFEEP